MRKTLSSQYVFSNRTCAQKLDTTYNIPLWYGPWAASIEVNVSQDAGAGVDLAKYTWEDASDVVMHAMADGEWGGCQFKVAKRDYKITTTAASDTTKNPVLGFSMGGFQQARGARLGPGWGSYPGHDDGREGNRYYLEGSIEFLDHESEWHFDASTRLLTLFPPRGVSLQGTELLLTQTDTLFELVGSASDPGSRVENIVIANLSLAHTSAQFFRPHEETSGGDYATHRSGAIKMENATGISILSNDFQWIGGNAVFLSNSIRNCTVSANAFRWLGTSGVAVQGKTGQAMMDGRDGEAMMAQHIHQHGSPATSPSAAAAVAAAVADNGVRLPMYNVVSHNLFSEYGLWDKQSACYHKALAPNNIFLNNVCFNSSRHGVNFQDGMGGGGIAEGNVMFNLNRETSDTTAFNSWGRRNYLTSDPADPTAAVLVAPSLNEWRRNLILGRDYYMIRDGNGNGLRNDDGASYYNHSSNILYLTGLEFNGGTQIHAVSNIFIHSNWDLSHPPDVSSAFNNTFVLPGSSGQRFSTGGGVCAEMWNTSTMHDPDGKQIKHAIYTGDFDLGIVNASGELPPSAKVDWSKYYCGYTLDEWQQNSKQDAHSRHVVSHGIDEEYGSNAILAQARAQLYASQEHLRDDDSKATAMVSATQESDTSKLDAPCASDADCSYNGICKRGSGGASCACSPAWRGSQCSTLNLLPARPDAGLNASDAGGPLSSWGGTVLAGDDGKWHMHVAEFVGQCGFNGWATNSRVVHAVADAPDGRYKVADVTWPVWAHNPAVVRAPTGEWVMTFVSNTSADVTSFETICDENGDIVRNSSISDQLPLVQHNFMSIAKGPAGPWSDPVPIDQPFDDAVPPFLTKGLGNRNTNIIISIQQDGSMVGLWRRCCSPPSKYQPEGGGGASVIFTVHATNWRNVSTWKASSRAVFPELHANGYEDPHLWRDPVRKGVFHAVFHNMVGGWHQPEFPNIQVGAHAYSANNGHTWVSTGLAFNLTVDYTDGSSKTFIQRERPHIVLNSQGEPTHLVSGVTYSMRSSLPTCTIVQPLGTL